MSPPLQAPQALGSKASGKDPSVSAEGDTSQGLWPLNLGQAGVEPHLEAHPCRGIFSVAGSAPVSATHLTSSVHPGCYG